ncbi:hypothetical protein SNEBB_001503 [Seison nebaliae]|nr:hypothetical protein SNEBB_001503 [Seison nebaliae]
MFNVNYYYEDRQESGTIEIDHQTLFGEVVDLIRHQLQIPASNLKLMVNDMHVKDMRKTMRQLQISSDSLIIVRFVANRPTEVKRTRPDTAQLIC